MKKYTGSLCKRVGIQNKQACSKRQLGKFCNYTFLRVCISRLNQFLLVKRDRSISFGDFSQFT